MVEYEVPVRDASGVSYFYFRRQLHFYTVSLGLFAWLWKNTTRFDVVHIHSLFNFPFLAAALAALWAQKPFVVRPLGVLNRWGMENRRPWLKQLSLRFLESHFLRRASAIHYTAAQERDEAAASGVHWHPVIIPNPVSYQPKASGALHAFRRQHGIADHSLVIGFVSRIDPKRGFLLLKAFSRACPPDARLVIAGRGEPSFEASLRKLAQDLRIDDRVIWPGFLSGAAKDELFVDLDLFVLPSYSENFGIAVVEALAAGLPVITTNQVALHTELAASDAAYIVPRKSKRLPMRWPPCWPTRPAAANSPKTGNGWLPPIMPLLRWPPSFSISMPAWWAAA